MHQRESSSRFRAALELGVSERSFAYLPWKLTIVRYGRAQGGGTFDVLMDLSLAHVSWKPSGGHGSQGGVTNIEREQAEAGKKWNQHR